MSKRWGGISLWEHRIVYGGRFLETWPHWVLRLIGDIWNPVVCFFIGHCSSKEPDGTWCYHCGKKISDARDTMLP